MLTSQNLKDKIIIYSFSIYIFFWSYNILELKFLRYFIIIPIIISLVEYKNLIKIDLKKFSLIPIFLLIHYFLVNLNNNEQILFRDLIGILFLTLIILTFLIHRELIKNNFTNILKIYFYFLIFFSVLYEKKIYVGSCVSFFFDYIPLLNNLSLSSAFFSENSHLAMMNVGAILSAFYLCFNKKNNQLLFLAIFALLINLLNLSTTFLMGYIMCSIIFLFLTKNNIFKVFLLISSIILLSMQLFNEDCNKKFVGINIDEIKDEKLQRGNGGLTSKIYERSIIISLKTLKNKPLGWGYDGTIKATKNYENSRKQKNLHMDLLIWKFNYRDALGNLFKIIIEFGFISFVLLPLIIKFFKRQNINEFEIFILSIFFVQLFRGAGYINGGFIIALTEIFLARYFLISNDFKKN